MRSSAQNSSGVHWCRRRVRFREGSKASVEGLGGFGAEPSQVQQGSGEGSREGSSEGLGGFGAESGQGSGEGSGKGSKVWEALVQSEVRFNRVPKNVPEKQPLDVAKCHACHTNSRGDHGDNGIQARHQSQVVTQSDGRCRQMPRLPHKVNRCHQVRLTHEVKVNVTKCDACHAT